ncbi:MAG: SusC/RagA family TonB-linked outer membrane protein [Flavobacterium sp.]
MKTLYSKFLLLLLMLPLTALAQSTVTGNVRDNATGEPLPGVNVIVEGTQNGTQTDMDGNYTLSNVASGSRIVFTFVGFATNTVDYTGQSSLNVTLTEDAQLLNEVVVIGYGSVRRSDATGSVTSLTTKDFNRGTVVTAENLINGRVAGVTINTSGAPGSGSQIRIRGGASLTASNDPLIVIDGLPITNETNTGSTSILASLNPNNIESFTILKDASATAIYGSRASNGVIIITTKKGGKELKVNYNVQYGTGRVIETVDVFSADEFRNIVSQTRPQDVGLLGDANTDWQDAIYRRTDFIDNNVNLTGNLFGVVPARLSLGNTYQEGLRLTNSFNRNSLSVSLNPSFFNDHLKFRVNANYANEKNRFADGVEGAAIRFDPTQPIYDADSPYGGFFEFYTPSNGQLMLGPRNPVAQLLQTRDMGKTNRIFGNIETEYRFHFMPELKAVVNLGFDQSNGERTRNVGQNAGSAPSNNNIPFGTNEYSERTLINRLFDSYLNYNKTIGKLNVDATAGYSYQIFLDESYVSGNQNDPNLPSNFPETNRETDNVLIGFFGRVNLSFADKYLLTATYRRDGSSRFSEDNRWGNFPAAAFAWKVNQEFFPDSQTVSDLKLRIGYGVTGQQNLGNDAKNYYLQQYQSGDGSSQYVLGDIAYPIGVSRAYNSNLKWEETTTYNAGLDYGLFNNRIYGTLDVFYKKSDDLLAKVATADGGNFSNRTYQNIGSFTSKGIEFAINADIIKSENINWNVNFNVSTYERRIDKLFSGADILLGDPAYGTGSTVQIYREDYTPNSFYVYKQLYDAAGAPIEGAYADLDGNGIINGDDRYIYKNPDPDATFGFASTFNYKNLDFSFNLRASVGNRIYNGVNATRSQLSMLRDNAVLGNIPTNVTSTGFVNTADVYLSDIYIENASFLRMDNITLGYTFMNVINDKTSVRLFAGVQNAFIITDYDGIDPEITNDGRDNTIYPRQRSFLFGANINF